MAKKDFKAHATVVNGKLEWKNDAYLDFNLPNFEGCEAVLTVKRKWNKRSLSQNSLYWVWVGIIAEYCGDSEEETHITLRGLYAPKREFKMGEKSFMIPRSTTTLSKGEMQEYMFHIEVQAGQLGIILPRPEDLDDAPLV
jgi:hypothetical protein